VPLLVVLVAAAAVYWRDPKIRVAAVTCAVLELCTFGGHSAYLPWHYLQNLPLLGQIVPERLAIPADAAAAAVLAFSIDRVRAAAPRLAAKGKWAGWGAPMATGAAVLAVLPLIPLPYQTAGVPPVPAGWQAAFARLHLAADAPVLVVPVPFQDNDDAMRWQADTGDPESLIGGYFIGPDQSRQAQEYGTFTVGLARSLDAVWAGQPRSAARIRDDISAWQPIIMAWQPAAVVAVAAPGSRIDRILTGILGPATFSVGKILAWRR
jgi:hypothetical protein